MKFRPRYFVALLWHWSIPFLLGAITALVLWTWQATELVPLLDESFTKAVREACK